MKKQAINISGVYKGDSIRLMIEDSLPAGQKVPYGTKLEGVYFDGYPQLVKEEESKPEYQVKTEKDVPIILRDGTKILADIYRPEAEGRKFPALVAFGRWGKDAQEAVAWMQDKPQKYYDTPFWDGSMEACNFLYTVARGYVHVIPEPRGIGNSEGDVLSNETAHHPNDIYDTIEWVAAQSWCTGKVGMVGPSSYSHSQLSIAPDPPPHLVAIHPDEAPLLNLGKDFHGIWDTFFYHISWGRHGNDSTFPPSNTPQTPLPPKMQSLPKDEYERRLKEATEHPDIKYNTKWYSNLKYPMKDPEAFDSLLDSFHPTPMEYPGDNIKLPMYIGAPWANRFYLWSTMEIFENAGTPADQKKMIVYPPGFPCRPYVEYHDEIVRWYDYWLKGKDTGIMDEPPIKMFVMGKNKWRFEKEWPLKRTKWTRFYLHPQHGLSTDSVQGNPPPDSFTQPAPYLDSKVYCLRYSTDPMDEELEITGPMVLNLTASIDIDDTNWMADLVDVDPEGNRQLLSSGYLKAKFRALDEARSKPYHPIHPRQEPAPVTPGEVIEYKIAMMPTANVFKKGHSMELIIRNQDDLLSKLGIWGVYMLPFMQTVTHNIHFGDSYLYLPLIPRE